MWMPERDRGKKREREGEREVKREGGNEGWEIKEWKGKVEDDYIYKLETVPDKNIPAMHHDIIDDFRTTRWWRKAISRLNMSYKLY